MKDAVLAPIAIPIGLVIYVISFALASIFLYWFFDRPQDWSYVIPILTSFTSLIIACETIRGKFGNISATITAWIVAGFWIFMVAADIFGFMNDIAGVIQGTYQEEDPGFVDIVNALLNTKIYAVTSALLAFGDK
ncbi:MAG: hypothetical protein IJ575_09380 [Selenomonadaceae bacterium]|nr:hypothetical protein [Selenomonadaceae bacterium]